MNSNKSVTANFSAIPGNSHTLTMSRSGHGTVSPGVGAHTYAENAVIVLIATPDPRWQLVRWTGDASGNSPMTTVTMDSDKRVEAVFELIVPTRAGNWESYE